MKIAEAFVDIKLDKAKFSKGIKGAKLETAGFAKSATKSLKKVAIGLTAVGVAAGIAAAIIGVKLTKAIIRAGTEAVKTAVKYDRLKIGLAAVAGGADEAAIQLIRLEKVAKLPGLSFEGAIAGSTALQAAGLNAQLAERSLLAFGNALVTVGKGAADLKGVNLALTQIVTKGSGFGQELRQLSERLPQVRKAMKDAFGISSVEDFKKLGLSANEFIEGLVREFEKLPKIGATVGNALENLGISFDRLKEEVGKTLLGITKDTAEALTSIIDRIRLIIPVWGIYRDEVMTVFKEIGLIILKTTATMMKGMIRVIAAAAPLMFKPLKNALSNWLRDFKTGIVLWSNEIDKALKIISTEEFETNIQNAINKNQEAAARGAANFEKSYKEAMDNLVNITVSELPKIGGSFVAALARIDALLEGITDKIPEKIIEPSKKAAKEIEKLAPTQEMIIAWQNFFQSLIPFQRSDAFRTKQIKERIKLIEEEAVAARKVIGEQNRLREELFAKDLEIGRDRPQEEKQESDLDERIAKNRIARNLETFKKLAAIEKNRIASFKRVWNDFTVDIQQGFTTMFGNMLTGGITSWKKFAIEIKDIFLRQLAKIAVSQAFRALEGLANRIDFGFRGVTGGPGSSGGGGTTDSVGGFLEDLEGATGQAATAKTAPGNFNVILPNADIEHMSPARAENLIRRQFGPAQRRLEKSGRIPRRM